AVEESPGELVLVVADRLEPRDDRIATRGVRGGAGRAPHVRKVVDRGGHPGESLVVLRARLPSFGCLVRRGPQLVGRPTLEQLPAHREHSEMRTEELVRRAGEDV